MASLKTTSPSTYRLHDSARVRSRGWLFDSEFFSATWGDSNNFNSSPRNGRFSEVEAYSRRRGERVKEEIKEDRYQREETWMEWNLPRLPSRELLDCWIPGSFVEFLCQLKEEEQETAPPRRCWWCPEDVTHLALWGCGAVPCARPKRRMRGKKPLEKDEAEVQKTNRKGNKIPCYTRYTIQNSHQKRFKTWFRLRLRLYTNHTIYSIYFSVSLHYLHLHTEFSALVLLHGNCMLLGWLSGCCGGRGWCGCTTSGGAGAGPSGGAQGVAWVRELLGREPPDPIPWGVFRLWKLFRFQTSRISMMMGWFLCFSFFSSSY